MEVTPAAAAGSFEYGGQTYYFCAKSCLAKFQADPLKYLAPKPAVSAPLAKELKDVEYTCPMDPEIVQIGPGTCPICGMALEPKEIQAQDIQNPELVDMRRRFWVSAALSVSLVVISMAGLSSRWIETVLATPVVLWAGWPFFVRAWQSILSGNLNMFTLIGIGVGAAYLSSVFASIFRPGTDVYFESAAMVVTLVLLGRFWNSKPAAEPEPPSRRYWGWRPRRPA